MKTLAQAVWIHISDVLLSCGGNVSQAARALDIHRQSLQRMIRHHKKRHAREETLRALEGS